MGMNDTIEQIDILSELTGVDLTPAKREAAEVEEITRTLRRITRDSAGTAKQAASKAAQGTSAAFIGAWEEARTAALTALVSRELEQAAFTTLSKRGEHVTQTAPWEALALLSKHVDKLGRELAKLDTANLHTADDAITAGRADDYTRATQIIDELHEIALLPEIPRYGLPLWVIIAPPSLPQTRAAEGTLTLADDHTPSELRLIGQAVDIRKAPGFREQILAAAEHGWKIATATSADEYKARQDAHLNASRVTNGPLSADID